jgi:hypothetical protein
MEDGRWEIEWRGGADNVGDNVCDKVGWKGKSLLPSPVTAIAESPRDKSDW